MKPAQKKILKLADINTDCKVRFKIDKRLAEFLKIDEWSTFKEVTVGMLHYNAKVKDFYDRSTSSFNAYKYPFFNRFFPDTHQITSTHLKTYLLNRH